MIKTVGGSGFPSQLNCFTGGMKVPRDSALPDVSLKISEDKILRVVARLQLQGTVLQLDRQYSKLIVVQMHKRLLHAGVRHTWVQLREHLWII